MKRFFGCDESDKTTKSSIYLLYIIHRSQHIASFGRVVAAYNGTMATGISESESTFELNDEIVLLQSLWRTEFHSPEILPYQEDLVESVKNLLDSQQEMIDDKIDQGLEAEYFTITIYQMDLDRVRYSLNKYMRVRLQKIEEQLDVIVATPEYMDRLSTTERIFVTKLNMLHNDIFDETILKRLADPNAKQIVQSGDDRYKHALPNVEKFVFVRFQEDVSRMYISEDQYQDFSQGSIAVLRYKVVKDYLLEGKAQLI